MLDGNDLPGHDAKLVQGMFDLYMDVDARNKAGYDPIKGSVEKILAAESLDDIKALYLEPDLKYEVENLMGVSISTGISDADSYYVWISSPGLIMSDSAAWTERMRLHVFRMPSNWSGNWPLISIRTRKACVRILWRESIM